MSDIIATAFNCKVVKFMKKLLKTYVALICMTLVLVSSMALSVYGANLSLVENIIAGKQDKLIFATIVSIGDRVCNVEVMEEIGEDGKKDDDDTIAESIVGKKIGVEGFRTYMYYEDFDHSPKIGDNVLLSLAKNGNQYRIKNGAFYVSAASHDSFNFIVPDTIDSTRGAMQLTALYRFVGSNGKNADYTIKDLVVYTHDTANNGIEIKITTQEGLIFVNEKGETTKEAEPGMSSSILGRDADSKYTWIIATAIILIGMVAGLFVSRFFIRLEKKADSK